MSVVADDMKLVTALLRRFYTASEAERWLIAPFPLLNGRRAIDLIEAGRTGEVIKVIERLEEGVFL
jgi:uncharacterized protein (DUF2384 family)